MAPAVGHYAERNDGYQSRIKFNFKAFLYKGQLKLFSLQLYKEINKPVSLPPLRYNPVSEALKIKQEIDRRGITQAEYARLVGCSRVNVTKRLKHLKRVWNKPFDFILIINNYKIY